MSKPISFLLEIGTEEIPARFFDTVLPLIEKNSADIFEKNRIEFSSIHCLATPRRLAVTASILSPVQKNIVSEITGPPAKVAFDENNRPTKAAEGFALSQGVIISDLKIKKTERGDYIAVVREIKGEKVSKILSSIVPEIILSLHFPKSMRWGYHSIRFARPIKWLLCLYDSSVVRFEIDGIKSGPYTWGHRLLSNKKVKITHPGDYEKVLKKHSVIVNHTKRLELIRSAIGNIAAKSGARDVRDEELLRTVNFLVEYPYAVGCSFPKEYLMLPDELLITVMKDHQKYFGLTDRKGKLVNSFVVISNTNNKIASTVRAGAEKVIKARFEDARFYYNEDVKMTLRQRLNTLKQVTYHEKIGTIYEKVERIKSISRELCNVIDPSLIDTTLPAAELSKADLTTGVVREFPELQGIIGYYYSLNENFPEKVALAIKEHYRPLHTSDHIPSTEEGKIISLADKIDSIASFFSVGITPTGSEDPFALRRQAQGIVQILIKSEYPITLSDLILLATKNLNIIDNTVLSGLQNFFVQRIEYTIVSLGQSDDIVQSLLRESLTMPLHILKNKAQDIESFKKTPDCNDFLLAIKRVHNILPDSPPGPVNTGFFSMNEERLLYDRIDALSDTLNTLVESRDFTSALKIILPIKEPINSFFENVLVMDKDENIRNNRLGLLRKVWDTALTICDFSKLSEH